jgi:hypothetical protein
LAVSGASLTPDALQQRSNAHRRSLYSDIPDLKNLRASSVVTRYEMFGTSLWLGVYLEETTQMALRLPVNESAGSVSTDLFQQDVALVQREQRQLRHRILSALSPAVDPAADGVVLIIRRRLKATRRGEGFLIPNGPDPEPLVCKNLPRVMPRGIPLKVRARVNWLNPIKAELTIREVMNPLGVDPVSLLPRGKMNLHRVGMHRRPAAGRRLQEAMDTKRDLLLLVTVAFDWASGEPLYLELNSFVGDEAHSHRKNVQPQACTLDVTASAMSTQPN